MLERLNRLNLISYLSERNYDGEQYDVAFWQDSIIEFIGNEFPEKKHEAEKIFIDTPEKYGWNWTKYYEAIADMLDSYLTYTSIQEFQQKFIKKVVNETMKGMGC